MDTDIDDILRLFGEHVTEKDIQPGHFTTEMYGKARNLSISNASSEVGRLCDSGVIEYAGYKVKMPNRCGGHKNIAVWRKVP